VRGDRHDGSRLHIHGLFGLLRQRRAPVFQLAISASGSWGTAVLSCSRAVISGRNVIAIQLAAKTRSPPWTQRLGSLLQKLLWPVDVQAYIPSRSQISLEVHSTRWNTAAVVVCRCDKASQSAEGQCRPVHIAASARRCRLEAVLLQRDAGQRRPWIDRHPEAQSHSGAGATKAPIGRPNDSGAQFLSDSAG